MCEETSRHDIILVLDDFNEQAGKEVTYKVQGVMGKNTLHKITNGNGMRVMHFAGVNNMRVHILYITISWGISSTNNTNQIDHILISKRWASLVGDTHVSITE